MKTNHQYSRSAMQWMARVAFVIAVVAIAGCSKKNPTAPAPAAPDIPSQLSPAAGKVMRIMPRVATLEWSPVTFTGAARYGIEIEYVDAHQAWSPLTKEDGLVETSYTMKAASADLQARWRVWATASTGVVGPKSAWREFDFNTRASQYGGTWVNDDAHDVAFAKLDIASPAEGRLEFQPIGRCGGAECARAKLTSFFAGEPVVAENVLARKVVERLSVTLENDAGTRLKLVYDSGPTRGQTHYFHKLPER